VLVLVVAAGCSFGEGEKPAEEGRRVSGAGLELRMPASWDGRLYLADGVTPVVQAASFPLPPSGQEVPDDPPAEAFADDGVYVALISQGDFRHGGLPMPSPVQWDEVSLPITVAPSHFEVEPAASGLSVASRHVAVDLRAFLVRVVLASDEPSPELLAAANDVLSTFALSEWRPEKCPPNWPGPWTACPEADWVRRVAETAGYRIVDETGSALVAEGRGDSFYINASRVSEKHFVATSRRQGWHRQGRVEGVQIFGDDIRRWWRAQGFVFWLHAGPPADATLPTLHELPALVRASLDFPPPG
jgi:hypothetical protein